MGITAGAEDVKYQAKYRELKKKVKEIEMVSHYSQYTARMRLLNLVLVPRMPFS